MRVPRSLQWRIALAYTALIFITMGAVSLYLVNFIHNAFVSNLEEQLEQETTLISEAAAPHFREPLDVEGLQLLSQKVADLVDARVTFIALDGTALGDSAEEPQLMEDQRVLPEVQDALAAGFGKSTRFALNQRMLFTARLIRVDGVPVGVARMAVATSRIQSDINRIIATIVLSALVVAFLSVSLSYFLAGRTARSLHSIAEGARRLAQGDLEHRVKALSSDETQQLADAFNRMAATIRDTVRDLSSERNKLSAVLDTMADGVVVVAADGRVELMNRAAEWLLSVKGKDAVGTRLVEVVRDHELQQLISRAQTSRQPQHAEVALVRRRRYLSAFATPLTENASQGVLLTLHDLTDIRRVETTRREFVSNVSHELRSPLASIKALVETLDGGALEEPVVARDFLRRINRDVDRMTNMVNDLLELSRLESGQEALHPEPVDLRALVEDVKTQLGPQADAKNISLGAHIPEDIPYVNAEEDKLRQVLVNLIENALKFTPSDGKVMVSAISQSHFVEVRVSDTGIGIAPEHLPHVFERFYKVDRARRDGGTGLGLAIVKHIVQAHGGDVRVESQEGIGSTFSFTVPVAS